MGNVSYLRTPSSGGTTVHSGGGLASAPRRVKRGRYVLGGVVLLVVAVAAAGALVIASAHASLTADSSALARLGMPLGGGSIQSASIVTGPHATAVPVQIRGDRIYPGKLVPAHQQISLDVVVKRPGWISWLAGSTQNLRLTLTTPAASLRSHYLTVGARAPLRLRFKTPIEMLAYGQAGHLRRHLLAAPATVVTLPHSTAAGTIFVAAAPRTWESARQASVSWFPTGGAATAVASPAPGTPLKPGTPITLTFSKPVSKALAGHLPPVSPITQGTWHPLNAHAIVFRPEGFGYGLGAKVNVALPSGVKLLGGQTSGTAEGGSWTVPPGSTVRLQQILSLLGYLPLRFKYAGGGVGLTPAEQEAAAVIPPKGSFSWRYPNTPASLKSFWKVGASGVMMQGALMQFENDHGMTADGVAGPLVWKALIGAVVAGHRSSFGYTFVSVSESTERLTLWHSGKTEIASTPVNTGIASAPTATGTFPVYEHLPVTTMSGTNPDGSHYHDTGIQYVSYFNGGDALHAFTRAQYGSPQSLGCVEMPLGVAGQVFPYTPIGTLVHVT